MKILITGIAGFIGYHLAKMLVEWDCEIYGIDNLNDYYDVNLKIERLAQLGILEKAVWKELKIKSYKHNNLKFQLIDIKNEQRIKKLYQDFKPDITIHLAAQAGVRHSLTHPQKYIDNNITGFKNILESCRDISSKLFYASSSSVYGSLEPPFKESDKIQTPKSIYAATKATDELFAHSFLELYGMRTTAMRFFSVYGSWGRPDMAIWEFTKKILDNEPIELYNNGDMKRNFTHVADVIVSIGELILLDNPANCYNIANTDTVELKELVSTIEKVTGKEAKIRNAPMQIGDVYANIADITRLKKDINYEPVVNIFSGIAEFVGWFERWRLRK